MAQLYNPLQKPSQATVNKLSVYLDEVNWVSDTNLLTLSVGLLSDATNVTSLGLNLHYDTSKVSYTEDTAYSLNPATGTDTVGQGIDTILTNGSSTAAGHIQKTDTLDLDGSSTTTAYVDAYWTTTYDASTSSMSAWPGSTDVKLYDINFTVTDTSSPLSFGFSADSNDLKEGYSLSAASQNDISIDLTLTPDDVVQAITLGYEDSAGARTALGNQSLVFVSSGSENTTVSMTSGTLEALSQEISFTHVEFASQSYDHGIAISDVVLQLRDIVGLSDLSGTQKIAADIDGDGDVAISDVVSNLRHIVGLDTIEQCALVDTSDQLVTSLTNSTIADLTLIQLGDVDLSSTFVDIA